MNKEEDKEGESEEGEDDNEEEESSDEEEPIAPIVGVSSLKKKLL